MRQIEIKIHQKNTTELKGSKLKLLAENLKQQRQRTTRGGINDIRRQNHIKLCIQILGWIDLGHGGGQVAP